MNLFEAIECVYEGYSVRHVDWGPEVSLTTHAGEVVLRNEGVNVISMTPLDRLHVTIRAEQLVSADWEVIPPRGLRSYWDAGTAVRTHRAGTPFCASEEQLAAVVEQVNRHSSVPFEKTQSVGNPPECFADVLKQAQHTMEAAEFEARIMQMQEAEAAAPATHPSVLRFIERHLAEAASDPVLLLLLDKWHTRYADEIANERLDATLREQRTARSREKLEGASRVAKQERRDPATGPLRNGPASVSTPLGTRHIYVEPAGIGTRLPGVTLQRNARTTVTHLDAETKARLKRRLHSTLGLIDGLEYKAPEQYPSEIQRIAAAVEQLLKDLKL